MDKQNKNKKVPSTDMTAALAIYNKSSYKKSTHMRVRIGDGLNRTADIFAEEILRALQFWQKEPQIVMQLCTGESPFIGYRKIGGDRLLHDIGMYNPEEFSGIMEKYGKIGSILDNWDNPKHRTFLKAMD